MNNILKGATKIGESEWEIRSTLDGVIKCKELTLTKIAKLQIELKQYLDWEKKYKDKLSRFNQKKDI